MPSCEEYRTTLEVLLIKDRCLEHCVCRWVPTNLQLADVLTKVMDPSLLRQTLRQGRFKIHDEKCSLEKNAHALAWSSHPKRDLDECENATGMTSELGCEPSR